MMSFAHPLLLLLAVPLLAFVVLIVRNGYVRLGSGRERVATVVRALMVVASVLALAGAALRLPQSREAVVFVVDLSASDAGQRSAMKATINRALAARPGDDVAGVVTTGRQPFVEQPVSALSRLDDFQSAVDPNYTNLEGGLELANAILPDGYRRRIILMTDGQENVGDGLAAARLLRAQGVRLDVVPVHVAGGAEVLVDRVDAPTQLRPQERYSVGLTVRSTTATTASIDLYVDGKLSGTRGVTVAPGENRYVFSEPPLRPGFHSVQIHITPAVDTQAENNSGSASIQVAGPPHILVIAESRSAGANVAHALRSTGMQVDVQIPRTVVPSLASLVRYSSIVIVNTAVDVLGPDLTAQLVPYVRDLGHGLVVLGGRESYGLGGYGQTPLEQALPVKMDLPKRKDLPSAAVVLIIESLEAETEINISKQAGKGVVSLLNEHDRVGVLGTPGASWAVPLQLARNKGAIDRAIDQMNPDDPMSYTAMLEAAYGALKRTDARVKHIILCGDGDAEDPSYQRVLEKIRAGGVTVSSVATNGEGFSDYQTMRNIARWGGGRYYQADNTAAIPKIFLREARSVSRSGIVEGKFYPQELSANPMVSDLRAVPPLYGYVATTPKPTGEMVLVSQKLDPVLAGWQFGLGRSVAWTSDATGLWTRDWLQAPGANRFWANVVSWTLPSSGGRQLSIAATSSQGLGRVSVEMPSGLGADPTVVAHVLDPNLHALSVPLHPSSPGHYEGSFLASERGSYFVRVDARGAGHGAAGSAGLDVPYPAEYRTIGTSTSFLHALARAGGGSVVTQAGEAWLSNLAPVFAERSLATWLWLLALFLLPVDIAVRRLIVTREDMQAIWSALRLRQPVPARAQPTVASLDTLRVRRTQRRTTRAPAASVPAPPVSGASGVYVRPEPKSAPSPPPPTAPEVASVPSDGEDSTTGRLLAAKRRRR